MLRTATDFTVLRERRPLTPAQSLLLGFAVVTVAGAVLLQLPFASQTGERQAFVDAFFTASSAVTTTGLGVVDTGSFYSVFGQIVIFALFQVGGLGYMVFIAFAAIVVGRRLALRTGVTLQESIAGLERAEYRGFVKSVFAYTLFWEALGATLLTIHWLRDYPIERALYLGVFHSVSAFCTAGFALFPTSFMSYRASLLVNVTIAVVTLAGAVGFFVLRDLARYLRLWLRRTEPRRFSLHTRIVLATTVALVLGGTALVLVAEPAAALGQGWPQRFAAASFQALSASTTTGFNSVDIGAMRAASLLALIVLMFIGASPGGTGGGLKTTTVAAIVVAVLALLRGHEDAVAFRRRIAFDTIQRSVAIAFLACMLVVVDCLILTATERHSFLQILFEVVSAFATVGLSTGITAALTTTGKIVISITMLVGRVGPLAIGFALLARPHHSRIRYAEDQLFIG